MKKIITLLTLSALLCALASCGGETAADSTAAVTDANTPAVTETASDPAAPETAAPETAAETEPIAPAALKTYTCAFDNGISVVLGGPAADALAVLGDHTDMMEAPSCVHEGFDRVYTYGSNYKVTTAPAADGGEYVAQIELLSDLVAWNVGSGMLMIGSGETEVQDALGTPAENNFGVQKYLLDGASVTVIIDSGAVTGLTIVAG